MNKVAFVFLILVPLIGFSQPFSTQSQWETYFENKIQELDPIEGIWSNSNTMKGYNRYNVLLATRHNPQVQSLAIYKVGNKFKTYDIEDREENGMTFTNTASVGVYLMQLYYKDSHSTAKCNALMQSLGLLEFSYEKPIQELRYIARQQGMTWTNGEKIIFEHQWVKTFPNKTDYEKSGRSSGTGFGLASNGIIVTNFHVIDGATNIKVRGVGSDFSKAYNAKILVSDKNNDLALIQIDDNSFTSLGSIPYTIKQDLAGVGENVFVLGYPLRATMGDEIKLTNGIVSSKSGFQGDITSYQVSAPVQPGNSGGPLFDNDGNLIGIVNAKLVGAENASYAIKASYLSGLMQLTSTPLKLQTVNSLKGKSLTEQVEIVKNLVYIIEIN